jgi:hypothetical protein
VNPRRLADDETGVWSTYLRLDTYDIVTYRHVPKQILFKQRPLLGNARKQQYNNGVTQPVSKQRMGKHAYNNMGVKAGSNTSTVVLQVVLGDEKGSLSSETVKYGREYHGTRTRE